MLRVPARLGVDELGELFGLDLDDDDVDTVGGLLAKTLGKVPLPGSVADVHGLRIEADRVEGRRKQLATVLVSHAAAPSVAPPAAPHEPETPADTRPSLPTVKDTP